MIRATRIGLRLKTSNLQIRGEISGSAGCAMRTLRASFRISYLGFTSASTEMWFEVRSFYVCTSQEGRNQNERTGISKGSGRQTECTD